MQRRGGLRRFLSLPFLPDAGGYRRIRPARREVGERGLVLCDTGDAIGLVAALFEFGEFTVLAMTEPELIRALCDRAHARVMHVVARHAGGGVRPALSHLGPGICTPPYLPPAAFSEFVVPYVTEMVALIHRFGAYARVHCHGSSPGAGHVIATGADAIDPLEPPPDGDITLAEVKARYGDRLSSSAIWN